MVVVRGGECVFVCMLLVVNLVVVLVVVVVGSVVGFVGLGCFLVLFIVVVELYLLMFVGGCL